jgi:tyrosine-specific transport protein
MSGLLIAELAINRIGETGNPGVGLLELYKTTLNKELAWVGSAAFLFLHYAVMVAYISQGGENLGTFFNDVGLESLASVHGLDQVLFATAIGSLVYLAKPSQVENVNNTLVIGVIMAFGGILGLGLGTADLPALIAPVNQHPEMIANAFPICFLSMVFHNVVPTVVTQLEGDKEKIAKSLIIGTSVPLVMFLAWNAIILGNIINVPGALDTGLDPIKMLQNEGIGGERLGQLVSGFSELAVTTSFIGFIYGLLDALTDLFGLPLKGPKFDEWKPALFAGVLAPPLLFSLGNPDIFFKALDYGGAFGVSTLFLVLPPIMVYNQRYGDENSSLTVPPMVPFGKIPLGSMWKAAGTLILEQGADKLGVFAFAEEVWDKYMS